MATKLIVGLGNPGSDLIESRHNAGFRCADHVASKLKISYKYEKKKSIYGKKRVHGHEIIILKPQTFSNLSGEAVLYIASFLKVQVSNILVIFDDINKHFGNVAIEKNIHRISHNAITHLSESLRSDEFKKCAFGIGPLPRSKQLDDFYLSPFTESEQKKMSSVLDKTFRLAVDALEIKID